MYRNPIPEVFDLTETYVPELTLSSRSTHSLQVMLLPVAHNMDKTFLIKWTNEVYSKLLSGAVTSPSELIHCISNGTLNDCLKSSNHLRINPTSIQVLEHALEDFRLG